MEPESIASLSQLSESVVFSLFNDLLGLKDAIRLAQCSKWLHSLSADSNRRLFACAACGAPVCTPSVPAGPDDALELQDGETLHMRDSNFLPSAAIEWRAPHASSDTQLRSQISSRVRKQAACLDPSAPAGRYAAAHYHHVVDPGLGGHSFTATVSHLHCTCGLYLGVKVLEVRKVANMSCSNACALACTLYINMRMLHCTSRTALPWFHASTCAC